MGRSGRAGSGSNNFVAGEVGDISKLEKHIALCIEFAHSKFYNEILGEPNPPE